MSNCWFCFFEIKGENWGGPLFAWLLLIVCRVWNGRKLMHVEIKFDKINNLALFSPQTNNNNNNLLYSCWPCYNEPNGTLNPQLIFNIVVMHMWLNF